MVSIRVESMITTSIDSFVTFRTTSPVLPLSSKANGSYALQLLLLHRTYYLRPVVVRTPDVEHVIIVGIVLIVNRKLRNAIICRPS